MVNFPTQVLDCDIHSLALLDFFLSILMLAFSLQALSLSVFIDFLPDSKQDALFHCISYYYSHGNWDDNCHLLRGVLQENILKLGAANKFC